MQVRRTRPLLFLTGLALDFYGLFLLFSRSSLRGLFWIGLGVYLESVGEGAGQESPGGLDALRRRVQTWDARSSQSSPWRTLEEDRR